jgi:hypothetical protein
MFGIVLKCTLPPSTNAMIWTNEGSSLAAQIRKKEEWKLQMKMVATDANILLLNQMEEMSRRTSGQPDRHAVQDSRRTGMM